LIWVNGRGRLDRDQSADGLNGLPSSHLMRSEDAPMVELTSNRSTTLPGALQARSAELPWSAFGAFWQRQLGLAWQWNGELLRFAAERWHKDRDTLVQLASCRSAAEVLCVQFEVVADAASDYLSEAQELLANVNAALQPATNTNEAEGSA
jgi:hypothetical protein